MNCLFHNISNLLLYAAQGLSSLLQNYIISLYPQPVSKFQGLVSNFIYFYGYLKTLRPAQIIQRRMGQNTLTWNIISDVCGRKQVLLVLSQHPDTSSEELERVMINPSKESWY